MFRAAGVSGLRAHGKTLQCNVTRGTSKSESIQVRFSIPYRCNFGQHVRIVGNDPCLGSWDLERAVPMAWTEGDVWTADVVFSAECIVTVEYKYAVYDDQGRVAAAWKPGGNFMLSMPTAGDSSVKIKDAWDEGYREVQIETQHPAEKGRGRRQRKNSGGEEDDAIATVSSAASNALDRLESAVNMSLNLMETSADAASPELIAADRVVAAAAQRAAAMAKALGVLSSPKEDDTAVQKKA